MSVTDTQSSQRSSSLETLIEVDSVSRYYGGLCAVQGISFRAGRGGVLGFLGPNGAGKTTTMQMICGVLAPTSGAISIAGLDIHEQPTHAKRHLGYLPEQPPLYRDTSVDDYLAFCAHLRRIGRDRVPEAVENAKRRCGLEQVGRRLIGNLSKGYQQRVGIAQAIIHSPPLIILDEPTAGLDPNQIIAIRRLIRELSQDHGIILSTHILPEVQSTCDRVLIIHHGHLVLDENLAELRSGDGMRSLTVALGDPPELAGLQQLEEVAEVTRLDSHRFRLHYRDGADPTSRLVTTAVEKNWDLYELIPEANSLEQTFARLTGTDAGEQPASRDAAA